MKPIATNKKAFRDYFFTERYECGIELKGCEVKAIREGGLNFKDSFARIEGEEIILHNLHISPYVHAGYAQVESDRPRKLLLHKSEIKKISGRMAQKGLALIPTKIYLNKRNLVKAELGLAKGKKLYDKREDIKKREVKRDIDRIVRTQKHKS